MNKEEIIELAKTYWSLSVRESNDQEDLHALRVQIENGMSSLSTEDQFELTQELRDKSIVVNGQEPKEYTGYGIIRDVFCENLVESLSKLASVKLQTLDQSAADGIKQNIIDAVTTLPEDQFKVLVDSINNYVVPTTNKGVPLSQDAINRISYSIKDLKDIVGEIAQQKTETEPEPELGE